MKNTYRILHLEDVPTDADLVARELRKFNIRFEHCVVDTETDYLDALNNFQPDIILCDHSLPSFNSLEALRIVKAKKLLIPFILITATMSEEVAMEVVKEGADDYILKDRLKRLPNAFLNNIEKYRFEKERQKLIDETRQKEASSKNLLEQLSNKLLLAAKVTGIGIWEYDIHINKFAADENLDFIYGAPLANFESLLHYTHPQDKERVRKQLQEALLQHTELNTEFRIVRRGGAVRYIKGMTIIERDLNGIATRIVGTNQDVTSDKLAEQAVKENEAKYRAFFENSMDAILLTHPSGQIFAANPAACSIFRMTEEEICKAGRPAVVDIEDPRHTRVLEERKLTGKARGELTFKRKDGTTFPGEFTSASFTDTFGNERTSMIIRDMSAAKLSEQKLVSTSTALKTALNDLQKIMDSSVDIICTIDDSGRFVNVSSACEAVWGYTSKELVGVKYMDFVFEEDHGKTIEAAQAIVDGTLLTMFENRYKHKNGSIVPILWSAGWDEKEKLMFCIAKDASEKKRLENAFNHERQRFYDLFLNAPASVGIFEGPEHVFQMANPQYLELAGRTNIVGKPVREVFPELENQGLFDLLDHVYKTGETFVAKEKLVKIEKEGTGKLSDIYLNFIYQAYRNDQNEIEGIFFFAIDVTEQVISRKKVEESEKQFRQLVYDLPEALYTCDSNGKIILYNKAAERLWGRKPGTEDRWCGSAKIYDADGSSLSLDECPMAMTVKEAKPVYGHEIIIERPDQTRRHVRPNPIPVFDIHGQLTGAVNMLIDITEIKQASERLRESNDRFEIVAKVTNDAVWDWNLLTNEIYWNSSYERVFGYKSLGKGVNAGEWLEGVHPEDKERVEKGISELLSNGGNQWQAEYRYVRKNGEIAMVQDRGCVIYDEKNTPVRFVGAMQDITDRKVSEEKLNEYQQQLLESQRIAHIGSFQMKFTNPDISLCPLYCSDETYRIFGIESKDTEVTFGIFSQFVHPDDRPLLQSSFVKAVGERSSYSIDFRIEDAHGKKRWVHHEAKVVANKESNSPLAMFGTIKDITVRKEQELQIQKNGEERELLIAELTRSIHDLKQFSFITSHNFRAPLSNLIGLLGLLDPDTFTDDNREIIGMFKSSTLQLNKTINDLIQILIIRNNVNVSLANINFPEILDNTLQLLSYEISELDCTINTELEIKNVFCNQSYLESILLNLFTNSIKYRSADRPLKINIKTGLTESGQVLITVQDNGLGIDLERHGANIFGLYQRFHLNAEGAGLGLFMIKSQITSLGGSIEVESEVDKGTTFFITLKKE